jgi:hypothetical protein
MDERLQFVARRLPGEPMVELCREFGISRKTGYKIFDRYQERVPRRCCSRSAFPKSHTGIITRGRLWRKGELKHRKGAERTACV